MIRLGTSRRLVALCLAAAGLLTGCFESKYQYVKNSGDNAYFRIPDDWKLYDNDLLVDRADLTEDRAAALRETTWQAAFDADPTSTYRKYQSAKSGIRYPIGFATVERLTRAESDIVSLALLRNSVQPIDQKVEAQEAEVLEEENLVLDEGFRGLHLVANVFNTEANRIDRYDQIAIVDQATSKLYLLVVVCEETCYDDYERDIQRVIESWTVDK